MPVITIELNCTVCKREFELVTQLSDIEGRLSDVDSAPCPNCSTGLAHMIHGDHDWVKVLTFQTPAGEKAPLVIRSGDDELIEQLAEYEASAGISIQHAMEFGFDGNTEAETVGTEEDDKIVLAKTKVGDVVDEGVEGFVIDETVLKRDDLQDLIRQIEESFQLNEKDA